MNALKISKTAVRKVLSALYGRSINHALKAAEIADIVSFDVFDTLILRRCKPDDVFTLAQDKYNLSHESRIDSFKAVRTNAGYITKKGSAQEEITLDEIYDTISQDYGNEFAHDMKALEIQAELEVIYPNEELQKFYRLMIERRKRIIIASDMYLSGNVIANMLKSCGYEGYEKLYVSSEFRAAKRHGGLFRKIIADELAEPSKILHIGDSFMSDYFMPRKSGINSFLYRK